LGPEIDINTETLINGCGIHTVREAQADLVYIDDSNDLLEPHKDNIFCADDKQSSAISHGIALKIAGCGISCNNLCSLYKKFGETGVVAILSLHPIHDETEGKSPPVTKNTRVLQSILGVLKAKASTKI
jgi:hypothetical protein